MAMSETFKMATKSHDLYLSVSKGHFVTNHSHMNYYINITTQKSCLNEARAVAKALLPTYKMSTIVDTILCLDGTEVIATCLAYELTASDFASINSGRDINILTPEHNAGSQLFFRDNTAPMINGKLVLILAASVVTGFTAKSAMESVAYYGGKVMGISSIFATITECEGTPVTSVFNPKDLPGYESNLIHTCPMCKNNEPLNALVNSFGCSML